MKILIALLIASAATAEEPVKGRLCVAEKKAVLTDGTCRDVKGSAFDVDPAERERLYLWMSADAKGAQIGRIAAKATSVALESNDRRELKVAIRGEASRGWPSNAQVGFRMRDEWRWSIPARAVTRLERIAVPAGQYFVEIRADHHVPLRARVDASGQVTDVREFRLEPLTRLRGRVVDAKDRAVAATVTHADGSFCTATDEQGAFVCELPDRTRSVIALAAPGFGIREFRADRAAGADIDLGIIRMSRGQPLLVKLTRDPVDQRSIKLTLFSDRADQYEHTLLNTKEVAAGEETVRFEDLSPGRYLIVAAGSEPLERLTVVTEMHEGEQGAADVSVEPFRLEGSAYYGDDPITNGTVDIIERDHAWRSVVPLGPDGTFGGPMWQNGIVSAIVGPNAEMKELVMSPTLGADPSVWAIRITKREIVGRIIDSDSKQPVEKASMDLEANLDMGPGRGRRMMRSIAVRDDSSYWILASEAGKYRLIVRAPDYMTRVVELQIAPEDRSRTVDIPLERGVGQPLEFVSPAGTPVSRVLILEGVKNDRVNPEVMYPSDGSRFTLRGRPGETRQLYFVPSDGSFATARILMPRNADSAKPMQIVIPPAAGSLRVRTLDPDDKPVPARILLRSGGEFIPPAILRFITGETMATAANGEAVLRRLPAGTYELWAVGSDEQQLIASNGTLRPAARVGLSAGEASVTVRVPKR